MKKRVKIKWAHRHPHWEILPVLAPWASTLFMSSSCQLYPSPGNPLPGPVREIFRRLQLEVGNGLATDEVTVLAPLLHITWLWWHMTVMPSDSYFLAVNVTWFAVTSLQPLPSWVLQGGLKNLKTSGLQNSIRISENVISVLITHPK